MKRCLWLSIFLYFIMLPTVTAVASISPLADDMLPVAPFEFERNQRHTVYQGPGKEYGVAANGKAVVSTNGEIRVFGFDRDYLLIQYGISDDRSRFGYIYTGDLDWDQVYPTGDLNKVWTYGRAKVLYDVGLSDDPFLSGTVIQTIPAGESVMTLYAMQDYVYVETLSSDPVRGFLPADVLDPQSVPYDDDPDLQAAVDMLSETGIEFQVTGRKKWLQEHLYFSLENGGTMCYLDVFDFYRYDLRSWYETDISDEDMGKLIDYFLSMAVDVQAGNAPEDHLQYGYMDDPGERNIEAVVSNILSAIEGYGAQGLHILLDKLSAHDGNDALNSMRAQAASRILGRLDKTAVSPTEGCAWYDALTLAVQNDLPPADASLYVADPLLCAATQLMLTYNAEHNPWSSTFVDIDAEKCVNIVSLHAEKIKETASSATIWGVEWYSKYALYDGTEADSVSGHVVPLRIEMTRNDRGDWALKNVTYAQDGTFYAPSILDFCDDNQKLANALMKLPGSGTWQDFTTYLSAHGYTDVTPME